MNVHEARWRSAYNLAKKMQHLNNRGYEFVDHEGHFVRSFDISASGIWYHISGDRKVFFLNNVDQHYGMEKTIDEFNAQLKKWRVLRPITANEVHRMHREVIR